MPAGVGAAWPCCTGTWQTCKCHNQHAPTSNGLSCRRRCCCMGDRPLWPALTCRGPALVVALPTHRGVEGIAAEKRHCDRGRCWQRQVSVSLLYCLAACLVETHSHSEQRHQGLAWHTPQCISGLTVCLHGCVVPRRPLDPGHQVAGYRLQVTGYSLHVAGYRLVAAIVATCYGLSFEILGSWPER